MKQNYNKSYRIASYHLSPTYIDTLQEYLDNPSYYSQDTFEIVNLEYFGETNNDLMKQPDILLISLNEEITEEMKQYSVKNLTQIVRVTDIPIKSSWNHGDIIVSFSKESSNKHSLIDNESTTLTELEYSVKFLKNLAQMANTSKLRYVSHSLLQKEHEKVMQLEDQNAVLETLMKLNSFIELKDEYTKMHSDHVSNYAVLLGKNLGLSEEELRILRIGGELHDIGKVGIPDTIIQKQGGLSDEEFEIMKRHTIIGDLILPNEGYDDIKKIIRSHHEKMDGTGYPDGLKGEEIPYFARILSVADTFDAMTTQRSYNRKKTLEEAFTELRRSARLEPNRYGKLSQQLDPILVESFIQAVVNDSKLMEEFRKQDIEIMKFRNQEQLENKVQSTEGRRL